MATLIFPYPPTHLDTYVDPQQATWQYDSDGPYWNVITSTTRKNFSGAKMENSTSFALTSTTNRLDFQEPEINIDQYFQAAIPGRLIAPTTGFYRLYISLFTGTQGSGSSYTFEVRKNGIVLDTSTAGPNQNTSYDETLSLNALDYVEVWGTETTGTGTLLANCNFMLYRIGFAPGTGINNHVAFSGARGTLNAVSNTTSTPTAVTWNDTEFNANANVLGDFYWYNTTPTRFSVKANGFYKCRAYVETSSAGSKNSYTVTLQRTRSAVTTTLTSITMSANDFIELDEVYKFLEDDYIEVMISNIDNTGAILATSYFEIVREGV